MNEEYLKHDFWSMVPEHERFERKFSCVFQHKSAQDQEAGKDDSAQSVKPDMDMVEDIFLGDEAKAEKKLKVALDEINTLKSKGNELK